MIDTEKAYVYELRRRQTIGNFLSRMANLGCGNSVGVGAIQSTDEQDEELDSQAKDLEPDTDGSQDKGGRVLNSMDKGNEAPEQDIPADDIPEVD